MLYRSPEATVGAIITKVENGITSILLALRNTEPYKNYWSLPGGHIDPYETAEHAVIREVKEEVGLDLQPQFLFYFDEIIPEKNVHAVVNVFAGHASGNIKLSEGEILDARWVAIDEALKMELAFLHRAVIQKYVDGVS
jgi:8-oxo-dGTP diphosphatase